MILPSIVIEIVGMEGLRGKIISSFLHMFSLRCLQDISLKTSERQLEMQDLR